MPEPSDPQTSQCISCKEPIAAGATVCSKCKSYQTRWKNYLQYAASIIGVLTVVATLIVYIVSKIPEVRRVLLWSDNVLVTSFASHRDITVLNIGDGKVFLSHVSIRTGQGATKTFSINKTLDVDEIITHAADPEESDRLKSYKVVSLMKSEDWNKIVPRYKSPTDLKACLTYAVFHEQDSWYLMYKDYYGKGFQTIEVTASLHFFSVRKRENKIQSLPVRGMLLRNPNDGCVE
jgi:predicted nucleic acid-binding Zn ribbon protein